MSRNRFLLNSVMILALILALFPPQVAQQLAPFLPSVPVVKADSTQKPVVAIHVSELTQALESMPAVSPTPTGSSYSGYQWFITSWHYFAIYESLKTALDADGTPYEIVTDADIAAGALLDAGAPRYPIMFSLATEAVNNNEIQPLRDYVRAGGFLFAGSSAFTRNPNGTTRTDFALASEMGLNMVSHSVNNWTLNTTISRLIEHRLVTHIPSVTISWDMLTNADDIVFRAFGSQQAWQVTANDAQVIAYSSAGRPLIATKPYGSGRFIYNAVINPLVGAGGTDAGMYAYTIFRNAIEWAFETANQPIVKRSPWPYAYDAAFIVRHDFEGNLGSLATIEASAKYDQSVGVKGEYYFCTGAVRTLDSTSRQKYINGMRSAVANYGATIGSHNGGYPNPDVTDPASEKYWHWGPDTLLDRTKFNAPYQNYTSGYNYSKDSIRISFEDIAGWLSGLDNGHAGCGASGNCPRTWVAPSYNAGRDGSLKMLDELGVVTVGEQKISPFPHWTLSYDPANPDHRYDHLTLPVSEWYVGSSIAQSAEGHTAASLREMVDFYYQQGYLINLYGHNASYHGIEKTYVDYAVSKPRNWSINAIGLYDWWVKRSSLVVTPSYSQSGDTAIVSAAISGAVDSQEAVELTLPYWSSGVVGNLQVRLNGAPASSSEYRSTNYGVKVRVGTAVKSLEVRYTPLKAWVQSGWSGGAGQAAWGDPTQFENASDLSASPAGQITLDTAAPGTPVFSDDFSRTTPAPWSVYTGKWAVTEQALRGTGGNSSGNANAYYVPASPWTNYSVQARLQFPSGATGGGGLAGRLDSSSGKRYTAWVYPGTSTLRLVKWSSWTSSSRLAEVSIPAVGAAWHTIRVDFSGGRIRVFWDGSLLVDATDSSSPYLNGGIGLDAKTPGGAYLMAADDVRVDNTMQYKTSGWLTSSAFDGGTGVNWQAITWNASTPASTSVCLRTRTADRADLLAAASWSDCYASNGAPVTSPDNRWLQYKLEFQTGDLEETPILYENRVSYTPGAALTASTITFSGPASGQTLTSVNLRAALLTGSNSPIAERAVRFTLDSLAAVTGTTDSSGVAEVPLSLNIAPGNYSLTVAFAGDSVYAPASTSVPFTVTKPANAPPVAVDDDYTTSEDMVLTIPSPGVLSNDSDADGNALTAVRVSDPSHGTLALNANGAFTYTPAANYHGPDSFTYQASDGDLTSAPATVSITVSPVNDPPTAGNDSYSTDQNTTLTIPAKGVLANDADLDGDALTAVLVTGPTFGALALNADGSFTYTPTENYSGSDSFTYKANDGALDSNVATVAIKVSTINHTPVAADDSYTTDEDTLLVVNSPGVLSNDSDVDGNALTAVKAGDPSHGTLAINADGSFAYTPAADYHGPDSFTYQASDGELTSVPATVSITVNPINDPPTANAQTVTTDENTARAITLTGSDVDNSSLIFTIVTGPTHGALSGDAPNVTYTPAANYTGSDSFTFRVSDGDLDSDPAAVSITVNQANHAPSAGNDNATTDQNKAVTVPVLNNDTDIDGDTLTVTSMSAPSNGKAQIDAGNTITYTPNTDWTGTDGFTYTISDGHGGTATANVVVTVLPGAVIFNDSFSTCNASAWTSSVYPVRISYTQAAAWDAPCGMAIKVISSQSVYLVTDTPADESHYWARFYFDPNTISVGTSSDMDIFSIKDGSASALTLLRIEFRYYSGAYQVRVRVYNDSGTWLYSSWSTIADQGHFLAIDYKASTSAGANNGTVSFWVDDTLVYSLKSIDNDVSHVEQAQLGLFNMPSSTFSGTLYFDAFESHR